MVDNVNRENGQVIPVMFISTGKERKLWLKIVAQGKIFLNWLAKGHFILLIFLILLYTLQIRVQRM